MRKSLLLVIVFLCSFFSHLFAQTGEDCANAVTAVEGTNSLPATANPEYWYSFTMPSTPNQRAIVTSSDGTGQRVDFYTGNCSDLQHEGTGQRNASIASLEPNQGVYIKWTKEYSDAEIPLGGLVARYEFIEGSLNDLSGNDNTVINSGVVSAPDRFNNPDEAMRFDNINDYLKVSSPGFLNNTQGSFAAWVKFSSVGHTQYIASVGDEGSIESYLSLIRLDGTKKVLSIYQREVGLANWVEGSTIIEPNKYYFFVMQSDGMDWSIYINGVEEPLSVRSGSNSGKWIGHLPDIDNFVMGSAIIQQPFTVPNFTGTIDNILLYNRTLDVSEIEELYSASRADFTWNLTFQNILPGETCMFPATAEIGENLMPATDQEEFWYTFTMPNEDNQRLIITSQSNAMVDVFLTCDDESPIATGNKNTSTSVLSANQQVFIKWSKLGGAFDWDLAIQSIQTGVVCGTAALAVEGENYLPYTGGSYWYSFPYVKNKKLVMTSSSGNTVSVYSGLCNKLNFETGGTSVELVTLFADQEVYFQWSIFNNTGFVWSLSVEDFEDGDDCSRAAPANIGTNHLPQNLSPSYWYKFTMPNVQNKKILLSTEENESVQIFSNGCSPLYLLATGQGGASLTGALPGQEFLIRWFSFNGGNYDWNLSIVDAQPDEICGGAVTVGQGTHEISGASTRSHWYSFTIPDSFDGKKLVITANAAPSSSPPVVAVYSQCNGEEIGNRTFPKTSVIDISPGQTVLLEWIITLPGDFSWNLSLEDLEVAEVCESAIPAFEGLNNITAELPNQWFYFDMPNEAGKKLVVEGPNKAFKIYSGSCADLELIHSGHKSISLASILSGTRILIKWSPFGTASTWNLSVQDLTMGDNCALAKPVSQGEYTVMPTIRGEYWYSFTMPNESGKKLLTDPRAPNGIEIYTGNCSDLTKVAGYSPNISLPGLDPNAQLLVKVVSLGQPTNWRFLVEDIGPGDVCSLAEFVSSGYNHTPESPKWFKYLIPNDGDYTISSLNMTTQNTSVRVYDQCGGNLLAGNDDFNSRVQSEVELEGLIAGNELLIEWVNQSSGFDWSVKQSQTISVNSIQNHSYGDGPIDLTGYATASSGLGVDVIVASGPAVLSGSTLTLMGKGEVTLLSTQAGSEFYIAATPVQQTFMVNPVSVSASGFTVNNKSYDGTTIATIFGSALSGVLPADAANVSLGTASFDTKNVGIGKVISGFTLSGSKAGNYTLTQPTGVTANITPLAISVTAKPNQSKVYGEDDPKLTYTVSTSLVSGDSFTGALSRASGENVKTYGITQGTLTAGDNYDISFENDDFTITPKEIEVVGLTVIDKVYDGTNTATLGTTYTFDGILTADDGKVTINTTSGSITFNAANVGNAIGVTAEELELSGTSAQNYSLVQPEGLKGNILPKPITATGVVVANKVYDGTSEVTVTAGTLTGVIAADAPNVSLATTATFADKNVATGKSISDFSITGTASPNYSLTQPTGIKANITTRPVTVTTAAGQNKQFGKADPEFTYTVSPSLLAGDELTGSLARTAGENVGMYPINVGTLANGNYAISFVSNDFEIRKANATIYLTGIKTFTYDGLAKSMGATTTPAGLDVLVTYNGFATAPINAGSYAVVASIVDASYQGSNATATLTITKANQSITFDVIADRKVNDPAFALGATATSGLTITYEATPDNRVTITNDQATIRGAGRVTITAIQPGDNNFNAAESVMRSFCINPAKPVIRSSQANLEAPVLTSDSNTGNLWFKNGNPMPEESNANFTAHGPGVYTLKVKVDDCVSEASAPVSLITTGDITTTFSSSGFSFYPNPFIHEIRILWNNPETTQEREVTLYDMMGHKIESKTGNGQEFIFEASGLSGGSYLIKGTEGNRTYFERIIKH